MVDESTPQQTETDARPHEVPRSLYLTILAHPDLRRIGDIAQVEFRHGIDIGRQVPEFHNASGPTGPLADRYLSRTPVFLEPHSGGLRTSGKGILVGGRRTGEVLEIDAESLSRGVCMSFRDRVSLWVRVGPSVTATGFGGLPENSFEARILQRTARRIALLSTPLLVIGPWRTYGEALVRDLHEHGPYSDRSWHHISVTELSASVPDGTGTLVIRDIERASGDQQVALIQTLERWRSRLRVIGVSHREAELSDDIIAAFDDTLDFPAPLHFEDAVSYFGPALTERLEALDLSELIDREPPWLHPEDMRSLASTVFDEPDVAVRLARRIAVESPTTRAVFPGVETDPPPSDIIQERQRILSLLKRFDYRISVAARSESISPNTLRRKMQELGIPVASELTDAQLRRASNEVGDDLIAMADLLRVSVHGLRLRWAEFTG